MQIRPKSDGTILAFGDSLTYGVGVSEDYAYPSVLSDLTGLEVINEGVSGEVTEDGLSRFSEVIFETQPDLVILLEGGNDILRGKNLQQTKHNLSSMISIAHDQGIQVVLIAVPAKNIFSSTAKFYTELAEEHDIILDRTLVASLLKDHQYKSDPIHFNKAGYRVMAESIKQLLIKNNALKN